MKADKIRKIIGNHQYTIQNGSYCFLPENRLPQHTAGGGLLGKIQDFLKRNGKLYYLLLDVFAPVLTSRAFNRNLRELLANYQEQHVILYVGSGPTYLHDRQDIINVDLFAFDEVDIVADVADLPIEDESIDLTINIALLEHVPDPSRVILEMQRILKPGGRFFCYLPFMVPYHAAPDDFKRWTITGSNALFSTFKEVKIGIGAGPTSGMLWILQEWLAICLSFGSKTLHDIIFLVLMVLTAPIKLLDLILINFPCAEKIASGFFLVGKK